MSTSSAGHALYARLVAWLASDSRTAACATSVPPHVLASRRRVYAELRARLAAAHRARAAEVADAAAAAAVRAADAALVLAALVAAEAAAAEAAAAEAAEADRAMEAARTALGARDE